jgi:AhpD family alkylhydroperoxidase
MPAPFLHRIPLEDLPNDIRSAHENSMRLRGDATFFEVFGNHEDLYRWYTGSFYGEIFHGGRVARRLKELLRLRLSVTHGCRFCNQGNRADALAAGLSEADIAAVEGDEHGALGDIERAVLRLADELVLTNPGGRLTPELYAELRRHFSDAEILELGFVGGILSGAAKFLFAFDLVEREDGCPFPGADIE